MVASRRGNRQEYYTTVFKKAKVFKYLVWKMSKIYEVEKYVAKQYIWYDHIYVVKTLWVTSECACTYTNAWEKVWKDTHIKLDSVSSRQMH